ncbi:uridine diphosphate glucose pyrophosphatase [Diachasma alloeum]|uniref:uridine diphosphate glucose pyrophosphatase n=1 Tax=Diachasma alloeum TaxID=454923 RepID=UPI000738353E|nr:uridine diphosphate glucose pyrophosphatase [Diachasma alloeum]
MSGQTQEERNAVVRKKMLDLKNVKVGPLPKDSPWLRPVRISFMQDGKAKNWDVSRIHDSVAIIIYNTTRKKLVFVRQFRPAVYYGILPEKHQDVDTKQYPPEAGLTLELCAGIIDKNLPLVEIARDELKEEVGYEAPASAFEKILTYTDIAATAGRHTHFYVEVTDDMHIHPGGGDESEGELIEVVEMSIPEVIEYISSGDVQSPPGFLFGVMWFLSKKRDRYT